MLPSLDNLPRAEPPGDPRQGFDRFWRRVIAQERFATAALLPACERVAFLDYYRSLPAPGDEAGIRRWLRGTWRGEVGWTARWIVERTRRHGAEGVVRVLDAGSGFGTYAMLFAELGADVTGVDLRPERMNVALLRSGFARARTPGLRLRYERGDLTGPWTGDYDLVWVYNTLSHVEPLEDFLAQARRHLRPDGVLVIGDINGSLAGHRARLARLRSEVRSEYVAPDGMRHGYALERLLPPGELRATLGRHGLRVVRHELYWGGLGVLPEAVYAGLVVPLQERWRLGVPVARRQLLVATAP